MQNTCPFSTFPSGPIPTVSAMPQWILFLVLAIVAWFVVAVGGGLLVGRLLGFVERHLPHPRRRMV
jgi:nitrate reductase NapE component